MAGSGSGAGVAAATGALSAGPSEQISASAASSSQEMVCSRAAVGSGAALPSAWLAEIVTGVPVFLTHGPLLLLSAVLVQTGILLVGLGLLAELLTRIYMDGERRRIYTVARTRTAQLPSWAASRTVTVNVPAVQQ